MGALYAEYGPSVVDTYGQANLSTIAKYSKYARAGKFKLNELITIFHSDYRACDSDANALWYDDVIESDQEGSGG